MRIDSIEVNNFFYETYRERDTISLSRFPKKNEIKEILENFKDIKEDELDNLEELIDRLNQDLNKNISLRFKKDTKIDRILIQVYDKMTEEVIKTIPPEEIVEFMRRLKDINAMVDEEA